MLYKTLFKMSTTKAISTQEQINALAKQMKALKATLPKKVTPEYLLEKREVIGLATDDLLKFSKTSKAVKAILSNMDAETFKATLSPSQVEKFEANNGADRYSSLVKSPSLVVRMFTPKGYLSYKVEGNRCSPNAYYNAIITGCTLAENTYNKRRTAKTHYSIK